VIAYDEVLADHIRVILADRPNVDAKKMFGGMAFILSGNMAVGIINNELIVRASAIEYEALQTEPGVRTFDMTGRPMRGWLVIEPAAISTNADLERWVARGVAVAETLPPK
jgi:TfoX/Sxy family transcriptional regulator of competence genes